MPDSALISLKFMIGGERWFIPIHPKAKVGMEALMALPPRLEPMCIGFLRQAI